jgi:hypothetical protein
LSDVHSRPLIVLTGEGVFESAIDRLKVHVNRGIAADQNVTEIVTTYPFYPE